MSTLPPILVVDDDPDDIFILKRLLTKAAVKNNMVTFEEARAVVAYLQAEISAGATVYFPCIVFSDLNMPNMDGLELAQWIRAQPALAETKVVVISSSEDPGDAERAIEMGAHKFLLKYPPASVLRAIVDDNCHPR